METYSVRAQLAATDSGFSRTMVGAVKSLGQLDSGSISATKSVATLAAGFVAFKAAGKVMDLLSSSMDAAISRFDTMQRYPKVMSALGYSAEESSDSVGKLADGIDGLPTKLDEVVGTAQRMTAITGNMDKSTDATLALNNAMLASGASTSDASRGLQQYVQMLSTGTVDLQSWKTLQETMPIGLQKTAEAMGFVGETAQRDLYAALKDGSVTFREFQNQLIDLGTGTGELAELARVNSEGIATSFGNLQNAAAKGIAGTIEAFDNLSQEVTGNTIAQNLDGMKGAVNGAFNAINGTIEATTPIFQAFAGVAGTTFDLLRENTPVVAGVATAYGTWKVIQGINSLVSANTDIVLEAARSGKQLAITTQAGMTATIAATAAKEGHTAAEIADMTATKASVASISAQNGTISLSTALLAVKTGAISKQTAATALLTTMTGASSTATKIQAATIGLASGALSISTVATWAMTAATTAFSTAVKVALGPIGWIVAGVGALATAGVALWKWLTKDTEASKELNGEQEKLADSTKELADQTQSNVKRRKEEISTIESNSEAYQDLGDQIVDLASKEKLSREEKKLLNDSVEQLNGSVAGLNLMYDEESKQLSMNSEQIKARIEAYKQQETANQAQDDLLNILKEQHAIEARLEETTALREQWNQKLEEGTVKAGEHKEAIAGLDEQETTLKDTLAGLSEQQNSTSATLQSANEAVAAAVENGVMRQVVSYQTLTDTQKSAVDSMKETWNDYRDAATNMFDTLSDKQELSVAEMTANLEENQRVMGTWADNIAILAGRGIDDGLLNKMREMGPEGAGYVAALAASSDEELQKLSATFANGGTSATTAFETAFDASTIPDSVKGMVYSAEESLRGAISAANFESLGAEIPAGATAGVEGAAADLAGATEDMANQADESFTGQLDINSPSGVFKNHGADIVEGAVQGVDNNRSSLLQTVSTLASDIPREFDSLPSEMDTVGANAMIGLANGIINNSGSALSAAQSIADQIVATINAALDIGSPSRVLMETGEFTTEGLAIGMLNKLKQAGRAAQEVAETVADNMQIRASQTLDLGLLGQSESNISLRLNGSEHRAKAKQALQLDIHLGERVFSTLVEDISDAQGAKADLYTQL